MIKTKHILLSVSEVPVEWVFEFYCNLNERLIGQELKIISPLNPSERTPSFTLFYAKNKYYLFKCFSTSFSGDCFDFVQRKFSLATKADAKYKVMKDYREYIRTGGNVEPREFKIFGKYKVSNFELRTWSNEDKKYWGRFHIDVPLLEKYNVAALDHFEMSKTENDKTKTIKITRDKIYGYFKNDGSLAKLYQPENKECKFIKCTDYVQGSNQLKFNVPNLLICSSLKDGLSFLKLEIPGWEFVAPCSENTPLKQEIIQEYKRKYKDVVVLFDNDVAGITAAQKYKEKFGLNYVELIMGEKDISDCCAKFGIEHVKEKLMKNLNAVICTPTKELNTVF